MGERILALLRADRARVQGELKRVQEAARIAQAKADEVAAEFAAIEAEISEFEEGKRALKEKREGK